MPASAQYFEGRFLKMQCHLCQCHTQQLAAITGGGNGEEVLFKLGKKHNFYGVKNSHYTLVRDSLVYTLGVALGEGKPTPLSGKDAEQWTLVWGFVESNMKKGQASDASYSLEG